MTVKQALENVDWLLPSQLDAIHKGKYEAPPVRRATPDRSASSHRQSDPSRKYFFHVPLFCFCQKKSFYIFSESGMFSLHADVFRNYGIHELIDPFPIFKKVLSF